MEAKGICLAKGTVLFCFAPPGPAFLSTKPSCEWLLPSQEVILKTVGWLFFPSTSSVLFAFRVF